MGSWQGGSTRQWRRVREYVLIRDNYRCQLRLPGTCLSTATEVHHTVAREVAGDDPNLLVSACGPCNRKVGDPRRHNPQPKVPDWF